MKDSLSADTPETSGNKAPKTEKRVRTSKDQPSGPLQTFAEVSLAKRKRTQEQQPGSGMEKVPGRSQPQESAAEPGPAAAEMSSPAAEKSSPAVPNSMGIRVKTLEEIRREKAARILSKQVSKAEDTSGGEKVVKTRLLKISKASVTGKNATNSR